MPAFRSRDLVEKTDLGGGVIGWRFKVVAGGSIPGAARRVLSEADLTWHEDTRFVPSEHTIYWSIIPLTPRFRAMLDANGSWKLTPHSFADKVGAKTGTRRVIEGNIHVKVPLVGKIAESFLAEELKRNYVVEPDIQRAFYRDMLAKGG
jgi:hypothetical protein